MRVRGFHPFRPTDLDCSDEIGFQGWIMSRVSVDKSADTFTFKRDLPPVINEDPPAQLQFGPQIPSTNTDAGAGRGTRRIILNNDVVAEILAATRASASWKACVVENTDWTGSAEENTAKYLAAVGAQDSPGSSSLPKQVP
jgi:hypothetical protein